jgi:hypothetical protein
MYNFIYICLLFKHNTVKTKESDQAYIMHTALLEISIQESIDYDDLIYRKSVRNNGSWVVIRKSTKKVLFRKSF